MTNFFCTRIRTLSLYITQSIYKPYSCSKIFSFFPTHTSGPYKSFFIYTRCSHTQEFLSTHHLHKNPSIHIFLLHTYIKTFFFFLYIRRHFIDNASFFLLGFLVHFTFRTTFLNEKFYAIPESQQTLLTTTKQILT